MKTLNNIADLKVMVEDELLRLANGKFPKTYYLGICNAIDEVFNPHLNGYNLVMALAIGWHQHTGIPSYPVAGRSRYGRDMWGAK